MVDSRVFHLESDTGLFTRAFASVAGQFNSSSTGDEIISPSGYGRSNTLIGAAQPTLRALTSGLPFLLSLPLVGCFIASKLTENCSFLFCVCFFVYKRKGKWECYDVNNCGRDVSV